MTPVLVSEETTEQPVLRISTKYMETFQPVEPLSGGSDISAVMNSAGQLDLYSVGTNDRVYRLRPTDAQLASYEVADLGIQARQLSLYDPLTVSADRPEILGVNQKGELTLSVFDGGVSKQKVFQPSGATQKIRQFLAVKGFSNVYANAILDDSRLVSSFFTQEGKWASATWVPIKDDAGQDIKAVFITMCTNNPVQSSLFAISDSGEALFSEENFRFSTMKKLNKKVRQMAVVSDSEKLLNVFAIDQNQQLWVKRQKKYSSSGGIEFDNWVSIGSLTKNLKLDRVFATLRFDGVLEVFAIGADGALYRAYRTLDAKKQFLWAPLFPLGNSVGASIFTVGRDRKGFAQVFTVTHDGRLLKFWQSEETTQWFSQELHTTRTEELVSVPTHALEVTVLDEQGSIAPDAPVTVSSSYLVNLRINGLSYLCSPVDRIPCRSGPSGKVVIYQQAVSLAAATLFVETPYTIDAIQVEPNGQLQAKLHATTTQEVYDAKDKDGNYLLPEKFRTQQNAESLAQIMTASSALGLQGQNPVMFKYRTGYRGKARELRTLDVSRIQQKQWAINFEDGFPRYQTLSADEVQSWLGEQRLAGVEFLGVDWGDIWNAIKNGFWGIIDGLKRIVVWLDELLQQVKVIFTIIVDGVTRFFETVLQFVQQAFDFIEGVWNYIKVGFQKLFEWLAFLFNFKDFQLTADAVVHTTNVLLDFTVVATKYARARIDKGIQDLKDELKEAVDKFLGTLNGGETIGSYSKQYPTPQDYEYASDHNLMLNAFMENSSAALTGKAMTLEALPEPIQKLLEKMEALANNFEFGDGKKAFDDALGYFSNIGGDKNNALTLLVSGFIKLFEAIALFALDAARGVVLSIMDLIVDVVELFKSAINEDWEIPIVSQLYHLFTGKKLSIRPITLIAYLVGVPSTLIYKVITGTAPFTEESLKAFKQEFTAAWLAAKAGIPPQQRLGAGLVMSSATVEALPTVFRSFYIGTVFVRVWTDSGQALANATQPVRSLSLVCVVLRFVTTGFNTPWALNANAGGFECPAGTAGFASITWLCQIVFGPARGLLFWIAKAAPEVGEVTLSLWGGAHNIMHVVDFALQPSERRNVNALVSKLSLNLPGQAVRFLALKSLNEGAELIPVTTLILLIIVGYAGSIAATAAQIGEPRLIADFAA